MLRSWTYSAIRERNSFFFYYKNASKHSLLYVLGYGQLVVLLFICGPLNVECNYLQIIQCMMDHNFICYERVKCVESDDIKLNPVYLVRLVVVDRPSLRVHSSCCYCCCCCRSIWYHHDCSYRYYYWNSITLVPTHRHTLTRTLDWWIDPNFIISNKQFILKINSINFKCDAECLECSLTRRK